MIASKTFLTLLAMMTIFGSSTISYGVTDEAFDKARLACLEKHKSSTVKTATLELYRSGEEKIDALMQKFIEQSSHFTTSDLKKKSFGWLVELGGTTPYALMAYRVFEQPGVQQAINIILTPERLPGMFFSEEIQLDTYIGTTEVKISQAQDVGDDCKNYVYATNVNITEINKDELKITELTKFNAPHARSPDEKTITYKSPTKAPLSFNLLWQTRSLDVWQKLLAKADGPGFDIAVDTIFEADHVGDPLVNSMKHWNPLTQKEENFVGGQVTVTQAHMKFPSAFYFSSTSDFGFRITDADEKWFMPEKLWMTGQLRRQRDIGIPVTLDGAAIRSEIPALLLLQSPAPLKHPNLSAYWKSSKILNVMTEGENYKFKYILRAQDDIDYAQNLYPRWASPLDNIFLKATKYVELQLPEIQNYAEQIRKTVGPQATAMQYAVAIVNLLRQHYTYDNSVLDVGGVIIDEPTSKLVNKKRIMCQGYSNLFVAIARNLGIPSRIINGLEIRDDLAFGHTWVEIEVAPNIWSPLDPQDMPLRFRPGSYLPQYVKENDVGSDKLDEEYLWPNPLITIEKTTPIKY